MLPKWKENYVHSFSGNVFYHIRGKWEFSQKINVGAPKPVLGEGVGNSKTVANIIRFIGPTNLTKLLQKEMMLEKKHSTKFETN